MSPIVCFLKDILVKFIVSKNVEIHPVCQRCPNHTNPKRGCEILNPVVAQWGYVLDPEDDFWGCAFISCGTGISELLTAVNSGEILNIKIGRRRSIRAVVFGSTEKPTHLGSPHRVCDIDSGEIYGETSDGYKKTGQRVELKRIRRPE